MSCDLVTSHQQQEGGLAQALSESLLMKGSQVALGQHAAAPLWPPKPPCSALVSLLATLTFNRMITTVLQFLFPVCCKENMQII